MAFTPVRSYLAYLVQLVKSSHIVLLLELRCDLFFSQSIALHVLKTVWFVTFGRLQRSIVSLDFLERPTMLMEVFLSPILISLHIRKYWRLTSIHALTSSPLLIHIMLSEYVTGQVRSGAFSAGVHVSWSCLLMIILFIVVFDDLKVVSKLLSFLNYCFLLEIFFIFDLILINDLSPAAFLRIWKRIVLNFFDFLSAAALSAGHTFEATVADDANEHYHSDTK